MRTTLNQLAARSVLEFSDGYRTRKDELDQTGFRIVRAGDLHSGRAHFDGPDFVSATMARGIGRKAVQPGDVALTTKGTVGRAALVGDVPEPAVYSPQICYFRVLDDSVLNSQFLLCWFRSEGFWSQASYLMSATDMAPYLSLKDIGNLDVDLPDLATQTAIADVLGALDDKIAANERVLDQNLRLRSGIFESLAKPLSVPMSNLARFVNGRNFTKDATSSGRPVIRIAELNNGVTGSTVWNDVEASDDNVASAGDILFAWSGSLTVTRWSGAEGLVNQHIFKVLPNGLPDWLVYHLLLAKLADYKSIAADKATTMGHIQRGHLDEPVPTPTLEGAARVDRTMSALWSAELSLRSENSRLAATRDALLPELMSGRLAVKSI
ncbi:restriction endonuclease subunit S [Tessaracoccus sp. Z1128]